MTKIMLIAINIGMATLRLRGVRSHRRIKEPDPG